MYDLVVITGPTATGKTALGVEMALAFCGEVVSADSMQVYRGMDIGTAKPTAEEMRGVPHHLIDVADPREDFSAAKYAELACAAVEDIRARGKLPIVVGGTGLYIDGLLRGTEYAPAPEDPDTRAHLEAEYDRLGGDAFRENLRAVDPDRAEKLAPGDKKRLVRAMEVYVLTGETITAHDERTQTVPPRYAALKLALDYLEREQLYARIDARSEKMFAEGLVDEVRSLLEDGVPLDGTAMQAIGYKEVAAHLRGELTLPETVELVQRRSRQYAKRQLTWLRRDESLCWLRWKDRPDFESIRPFSTGFPVETP